MALDVVSEAIRVLRLEGNAILQCATRFNENQAAQNLARAIELMKSSLDQGGKIIVTGLGKSGKIAQKVAATLSSTGSLAVFLHPTEGLHGDLGVLTPRDVILAFSYTGNTEELIRLIPSIRGIGVSLIGIGGNPESQLAPKCDVWLDAKVEQEACPHNLAPTCSTTLALAIGDALAVTLMQIRGFDEKAFALNHPGGALGRRLSLRVSDLMHTGAELGVVSLSADMDSILVTSTEKKLGGILVTDANNQMVGIITDGDIRRALKHREKFFSLSAKDIMTPNPVTIRRDALAKEALDLMENRPSQISVLPVLNEKDEWVGLIRIHDLVKNL